jgi:pSer/pThr/pTyr-binding forkhead associated (FHA) protein
VIVCPRCSKENQDHYKFCLGCGSELPREPVGSRVNSPQTPPSQALSIAQAQANALQNDTPAAIPDKALEFARTHQTEADRAAKPIAVPVAPAPLGAPAASAVAPPAFPTTPRGQDGGSNGPAASSGFMGSGSVAPAPILSGGAGPNSCPACGNPVPVDFKFCGTCGHRMPSAQPSSAAVPAAAPPVASKPGRGSLIVINPDGTEGGSFQLSDGSTSVGRNHGGLFAADAYLSPLHATFTFSGPGAASCNVKDESSLNGIYVKLRRDVPVKLADGDIFRIGQELIRFDALAGPQFVNGVEPMGSPNPGYVGRLSLVIGRESYGNGYAVPPDGIHLGRERGDVIFPEDGYVSGLHCRVHFDGASCVLTDVGSSNGTFVRVRGGKTLVSGDLLLMGQQLFRLQF